MNNKTNYIPEGFKSVNLYLILKNVNGFLQFIKEAFDAEILSKTEMPDGSVMHADVKIGNSRVMMGEASGNWQPMPASIYLYVEDADKIYNKALQAGATSLMEPRNEFYGDRMCGVADKFGNQWWIATHVEDVSPEEMKRREEEYMKSKQ